MVRLRLSRARKSRSRQTRKLRKRAQRGGSEANGGKQPPVPSIYYKTFPNAYIIDYILSNASDNNTLTEIQKECDRTSCNLCIARTPIFKTGENLLFMAVKKDKINTAKYLLSKPFDAECLGAESVGKKVGKNVLTLLVEDRYCQGDASIFSGVVDKPAVYKSLINVLCNNMAKNPSRKSDYLVFLDKLNALNLVNEPATQEEVKAAVDTIRKSMFEQSPAFRAEYMAILDKKIEDDKRKRQGNT